MRALLVSLLLAGCHGRIYDGPGGGEGGPACDAVQPIASDMRRLTAPQYRRAIASVFEGHVTASDQFPAPTGTATTGYSTELGLDDLSEQDVENATYSAEDIALQIPDALPMLLPCASESSADAACAGQFLDKYGRRAFRRTLTDDEKQTLLATFQDGVTDGATFAESIALMTDHLLQTPQFLYVAEYSAPSTRPLNGFEIANRLSFLLWDSIPDDDLLNLAESGQLASVDQVVAQAGRMLDSPNADTAIARFFREWTQTAQVSPSNKSQALFPDFDANQARSMNESFDRFAIGTVRGNGSLRDILRSNTAYVDANMAQFFGVAAPSGADWAEATLDPTRYSGIVTQPAMLATLAHSDRASYVYRGRFLRKRLLCDVFGPPPMNAMSVQLMLPPNPTAQEESAARQSRSDCSSCHALMDPAGLSLQRFDAVGHYSATDSMGRTIDVAGTLHDVSGSELAITDHVDMMEQLAELPAVEDCFARQLFRFSMSRAETPADECAIQSLRTAMQAADGNLKAALVAIVGTNAFLTREAP